MLKAHLLFWLQFDHWGVIPHFLKAFLMIKGVGSLIDGLVLSYTEFRVGLINMGSGLIVSRGAASYTSATLLGFPILSLPLVHLCRVFFVAFVLLLVLSVSGHFVMLILIVWYLAGTQPSRL